MMDWTLTYYQVKIICFASLLRKAKLRCVSHGFAALSDAPLRVAKLSNAERSSVWLSWSSAWLRFQQHQSHDKKQSNGKQEVSEAS